MFSRGKQLVKLAIEKNDGNNVEGGRNSSNEARKRNINRGEIRFSPRAKSNTDIFSDMNDREIITSNVLINVDNEKELKSSSHEDIDTISNINENDSTGEMIPSSVAMYIDNEEQFSSLEESMCNTDTVSDSNGKDSTEELIPSSVAVDIDNKVEFPTPNTDENNNTYENNNTDETDDTDCYDDDVVDPDWAPPKRKKRKKNFRSENRISKLFYKVIREKRNRLNDLSSTSDSISDEDSDVNVPQVPTKLQNLNDVIRKASRSSKVINIPVQESDMGLQNIVSRKPEDELIPITAQNPNDIMSNSVRDNTVESIPVLHETDELEMQKAISSISEAENPNLEMCNAEQRINNEAVEIQTNLIQTTESDIEPKKLMKEIDESTSNKKKKMKQLREKGLKYKGQKANEHGQKPYCVDRDDKILVPSKCSKRCDRQSGGRKCKLITEANRKEIFSNFWYRMNWDQKKVYVLGLTERVETKRDTTDPGTDSRRQFTYTYFLKVGGECFSVCKNMFLSTLGISETMVYDWTNKANVGVPRKRERRQGNTSDATRYAKEYLSQLPKVPSHYCRASTNKSYIEPTFSNVSHLHREYLRKLKSESKPCIGLTAFKTLFQSMNLSLFHPKKDLCDTCCGYQAGTIEEEKYSEHVKKKTEAQNSKQIDKERSMNDSKVKVLTVDLQSLLLCPKLNASCLYYKTKLSCHNYTVYDLASHKVLCYFWHEVDGELSSNVFASCLIDYLEQEDLTEVENVIIYSDGCGYQNRNVTLSNALLQFAVTHQITIEQKYLERGHTQMECDSAHSVIERQIKHKSIYVPQNYVDNIKAARKSNPYIVKYVDFNFFKDYSKIAKYSSIRPGSGVGSTTVNEIRSLKYDVEGQIYFKTEHGDDSVYLPLPTPRKSNETEKLTLYLNISTQKFYH